MTELLPDGSDWSRPECRLLARFVPMEAGKIASAMAPIPGVEAEPAISAAERTWITSSPEANC